MSVALISGASSGIGRATTLRLAGSGWTVLAGVRDPKVGEELAAEGGSRVIPVILDVTDAGQIARTAELVEQHTGAAGLDALVNNAGIGLGGPLELMPLDELRRQFEVNVFGHVAVIQAMLPALRRARGRILLVSSVGGRVTTPFLAPYCASKSALEVVGDSLRIELLTSNVQVALIEPGSVSTPIWDKSAADLEDVNIPPEFQEQYGHVVAAMTKALEDTARRGIPPQKVAETIEQALTAKRMQTRYLVGRDAHLMVLARRLLPDRMFDRILRRALGV